jgi:translation initiation factor 2 subunit 3
MDLQPVMNIGMLGHVSDGKTTITKQLTGTLTQKHSSEKQKNLTIRLGYANAKICKCPSCPAPSCYFSVSSDIFDYYCPQCVAESKLMNHISFVDCPGHNMLLTTMLNGTSVMDYTIIVESVVNTQIPAPQTREHFDCIRNMNIKNIAFILNKIDLIPREKTEEICDEIKIFLKHNKYECPIIPTSATHQINIDILCMILAHLPLPTRNINRLKMPIIRSFNINKPGTKIEDLTGGVIGGSICSGILTKNQDILLVPGMIIDDIYKPLKCNVISINSEKNNLLQATSGGLIGIKLDIDPGLTCDDGLAGNIVVDKINGIVTKEFELRINKTEDKNWKYKSYTFNINSNNITGKINKINDNIIRVYLDNYQYIENNDIITISINNGNTSINLLDYCKFDNTLNFQEIQQQ